MLEIAIFVVVILLCAYALGSLIERLRKAQEPGLSPDEIRRKRALERMVDNINL